MRDMCAASAAKNLFSDANHDIRQIYELQVPQSRENSIKISAESVLVLMKLDANLHANKNSSVTFGPTITCNLSDHKHFVEYKWLAVSNRFIVIHNTCAMSAHKHYDTDVKVACVRIINYLPASFRLIFLHSSHIIECYMTAQLLKSFVYISKHTRCMKRRVVFLGN